MSKEGFAGIKELRYNVMLALYFPILLYAFSTFDLSDETFAIENIEPVVVGEQTVVLGQPFEARTFLAVGGGQGQSLEGYGDLAAVGDSLFRMPTDVLLGREDREKTIGYHGLFRFQQLSGAEAEIPVSGSFVVRRPEIIASSEATQTLYRECLNNIRIDVPGLEKRTLILSSGGRSIEGRSIAMSPSGKETVVTVSMDNESGSAVFLGEKRFAVIDPPRPELKVSNAGREITNGDNVPMKRAILAFVVTPDQEFQRRYPRDARYAVGQATVYLRKGLLASKKMGTYTLEDNQLVLTRVLREAQPGDRLMIRLEGVYRINHAGRAIPVQLSEASRTMGFVLS